MTSPQPSPRLTPWQMLSAASVWVAAIGAGYWLWTSQQEVFHPAIQVPTPRNHDHSEMESILTGRDHWVVVSLDVNGGDQPPAINPADAMSKVLRPEARPTLAPWPGTVIARKMIGGKIVAEAIVLGPTPSIGETGGTPPVPAGIRARRVSMSEKSDAAQKPAVIYVLELATPAMGIS